jgi:hypothetical protein
MTAQTELDQWRLCSTLERASKVWWGAAMLVRLAGLIVGVMGILGKVPAQPVVFVVAVLGIAAELATLRSDRIRRTGQGLRRQLEFADGLGWEIGAAEYSDLVLRCPSSVKKRARREGPAPQYFASALPAGPERAVENLSESAWWSKHLAESMRGICGLVVIATTLGSIVLLVVAIEGIQDRQALDAVARVVTSVLMLLFSLGLVRLVIAYHDFAVGAARAEEAALRSLTAGVPDEVNAVKMLHAYQMARAAGPLLPDWVWKWRQQELNELWKSLRSRPRS